MAISQYFDPKDPRPKAHTLARKYKDDLKEKLFIIWYESGKPTPMDFHKGLAEKDRPSLRVIRKWIQEDWYDKGYELDQKAIAELDRQLIAGKVEMLQRHIGVAQKMQHTALEFLEAHPEDMNSNTAVRMLVEGIRIERESAGIPAALEKYQSMSDEDLVKSFTELVKKSPVKILPSKTDDNTETS